MRQYTNKELADAIRRRYARDPEKVAEVLGNAKAWVLLTAMAEEPSRFYSREGSAA